MKINELIDRFASRTHSPRGKYAASAETYRELLSRLPENDRPDISPEISPVIGKETPTIGHRRWAVAASAALILGIGVAIAAVVTYHKEFTQSNPVSETSQKTTSAESEGTAARLLVFDNTPLRDIVAELSATYGVEILIEDEALANYRITATFSTEETLDEILEILAEAGDFEYRTVGERIILTARA